jgi:uncharacterized oxidoreductase
MAVGPQGIVTFVGTRKTKAWSVTDRNKDRVADEVKSYVEFVKSATPTTPDGKVLVPGEKERATLAERTAGGLPLAAEAWSDILDTAKRLGISDPEIAELTGGTS